MKNLGRKVVLASRNPDKVREMRQLFHGLDFEFLSSADFPGLPEVIEDGTTVVGNARRKAILTAAFTGEIAVADDTSLEVRELNGFPDIFAARFSGAQATYQSNVALLLELMSGVPVGQRQARFSTGCAWVDPRPSRLDLSVAAPARNRWLRNPWARAIGLKDSAQEWAFWNGLVDRREVWDQYRRNMELDLSSWGHPRERLRQVANGLFLGCEDALRPGEKLDPALVEEGVRLPDSRIWAVTDPNTSHQPLTLVAPSGLPADAPGRETNGPWWFEVSTLGRVLGDIATHPVGKAGFGYDPVFMPEGGSLSLAELPAAEKNAISHRGRALRRLLAAVADAYSEAESTL